MVQGRPGPAPQTGKRAEFARLIARGVSNTEACRTVGINRRTGKRWRHGRTITTSSGEQRHYPSVINQRAKEISARFLSEDERVRLADLVRQGAGVRTIAQDLARSPSTVSRELRRNRDASTGRYGRSPRSSERWSAGPVPGAASCAAIHD